MNNDDLLSKAVLFELGYKVFQLSADSVMTALVQIAKVGTKWQVNAFVGPMNRWGLTEAGTWRYKDIHLFPSLYDAVRAFEAAHKFGGAWEGYE